MIVDTFPIPSINQIFSFVFTQGEVFWGFFACLKFTYYME